MKPIRHTVLDCETFEGWVEGKVEIEFAEDLCGKVPHVGCGGASKSKYVSRKTGQTVFVLERHGMCSGDAYSNDVWLFAADFTAEEAARFLKKWDKNICYETPRHVIVMATIYKAFLAGYSTDDAPVCTFKDMTEAINWADAQ